MARCRCCHSGVRRRGSRLGSSSDRAAHFAKARGEQRRPADLGRDDRLDLVGVEDGQLTGRRFGVGVGQPQHDAVVGVHRRDVEAVALAQPGADRQRPRRVDRRPERGVDDQPPVAQLVTEAFDQHGAVVGQVAGGLALLGEVGEQVRRAPVVQAGGAGPGRARLGIGGATSRRNAPSARPSSTGRPGESPFQNGIRPISPGAGRHQDPVVGDVLDAPGRRAEQEHVADPRLVDHLLVQLADAPGRPVGAGEEDAEQAAVGDRAAAGDGQPLRAAAGGQLAGDPVPDQPGTQLGERVGRVAPGQHVEHRLERRAGQAGERRGPADDLVDLVDGQGVQRDHRDDLLGEDVERVARVAHRLDRAGAHPLGDDGALEQVAAELREDHARETRRRPGARPGRPAAARRPPTAATRPGRRGRPRPCRCRARATRWRRRPAAGRP